MCISECNDREGAKIVKSFTECHLSESEISSIPSYQNYNFPMASINLQKNKINFCCDIQKLLVEAAVK